MDKLFKHRTIIRLCETALPSKQSPHHYHWPERLPKCPLGTPTPKKNSGQEASARRVMVCTNFIWFIH